MNETTIAPPYFSPVAVPRRTISFYAAASKDKQWFQHYFIFTLVSLIVS